MWSVLPLPWARGNTFPIYTISNKMPMVLSVRGWCLDVRIWRLWIGILTSKAGLCGRARYLSVTESPHNTEFFYEWMGKKHFVSLKPPRLGNEPRTLAWKAAVLTTTLGPPAPQQTDVVPMRRPYTSQWTQNYEEHLKILCIKRSIQNPWLCSI